MDHCLFDWLIRSLQLECLFLRAFVVTGLFQFKGFIDSNICNDSVYASYRLRVCSADVIYATSLTIYHRYQLSFMKLDELSPSLRKAMWEVLVDNMRALCVMSADALVSLSVICIS